MASDALEPLRPLPAPKPYQPTVIERRMYDALDALGIRYIPQQQFGWYYVDAYLPDYHLVLEAEGCVWHCCWECHGDEPDPNGTPATEVRRKRHNRDTRLRTRHHVKVSYIWGHDLLTDLAALFSVRAALERRGITVELPYEPGADDVPLPLPTYKEAHAAKVRATWERKRERSAERNAEWDAERERRKRAERDIAQLRTYAERESEQYLRSLRDEDREDTEQ